MKPDCEYSLGASCFYEEIRKKYPRIITNYSSLTLNFYGTRVVWLGLLLFKVEYIHREDTDQTVDVGVDKGLPWQHMA